MKAIQCVAWGLPDRLVLADVPLPEPAAGQVRVRVEAAGVNFPDALLIQRKYQAVPPLPFTPGAEIAGVVDAVGAEVRGLNVGDRVVAYVGIGGFAEYVCAPVAMTWPLPPEISTEQAAAFTLTYATSHHALFARGALQEGQTLLVLGAGGGVGLAAVELGRIAGARVIAAASSEAKLGAAREHGADETIDYATVDLRDALKGLTAGKGADVIFDPVGGAYTEAAVRSLAWHGRLLVVGFADGTIPQIAANWLLLKEASAVGVFWGEFAQREPQANGTMLKELYAWLAQGRLRPRISQRYALADAPRALEALLARKVVGKLVITP